MLYWHRWASLLAGVLLIYILITGLWMQSMDLFVHVANRPASDPTIQEFRQHINGTDNYAVISDPDYAAMSLPRRIDAAAAFARIAAAARRAGPGRPMTFIELRMTGDRVTGQVRMGDTRLLYDAQDVSRLPDALLPPANPNEITHGLRASMKSWHKFAFNKVMLQKASILNLLVGVGVLVLMVTGFVQYLRLLRMRRRIGKPQLFWPAGGFWRKFHRWTAIVSAVLVLYLTVTGMLMAVSDLGAAYAEWKSPRELRARNPDKADYSSPLADAELPAMTRATLAAFGRDHPDVPLRVLRLRYFAGYPQGAVVTGEATPVQHVYDTRNGRELSLTEPGYPVTNFPFGWQWHQTVKRFHRGDIIGLGGNAIEWLAGAALLYLAGSGLWMYYEMWRKRARAGRRKPVWR